MNNVKVVIGANFGDEGKGITTNHFAKEWADIVVRFNGGAQAAHTVKNDNGFNHIFGHFTSGTGEGLPSYFSKHFIINPFIFFKELESLERKLDKIPALYFDPECPITTLYDMYINKILERIRGNDKHGSCGIGINETVERNTDSRYSIKLKDIINNIDGVIDTLYYNLRNYYPARLKSLLGPNFYDYLTDEDFTIMDSTKMFQDTVDTLQLFSEKVETVPSVILRSYNNVLFEGAQGLLLDENHEFFPHVTRSNTGFKNVQEIISDIIVDKPLQSCEVFYITRCYLTRHGAGPFPTEQDISGYFDVVDETNIPNEFQGSLRTGFLDLGLLYQSINRDSSDIFVPHTRNVVVTCLDQIKISKFPLKVGPEYIRLSKYGLCDILHAKLKANIWANKSSITGTMRREI